MDMNEANRQITEASEKIALAFGCSPAAALAQINRAMSQPLKAEEFKGFATDLVVIDEGHLLPQSREAMQAVVDHARELVPQDVVAYNNVRYGKTAWSSQPHKGNRHQRRAAAARKRR